MDFTVNRNRTDRRYALAHGLQVRTKRRDAADPAAMTNGGCRVTPNERWSMDFVHDPLADRRCSRMLKPRR